MTGDAGSANHYRGANAYPNPINATRRFVIMLTQYGTNHHEARDINRQEALQVARESWNWKRGETLVMRYKTLYKGLRRNDSA